LDLFSGCGGLSLGLKLAGLTPLVAIDNWGDALRTFSKNNPKVPTICADLSNFDPTSLPAECKSPTIIVGGPPCQGFSISGKRNPNDPRNQLFLGFVNFVESLKPECFLMENVPNMASMENGRVLAEVKLHFESLGYLVFHQILLASDFGVPQNRRRLFLVGIKQQGCFDFPKGEFAKPESKWSTSDAISDLPECSVQDGDDYPSPPLSEFQVEMRRNSNGLWNHEVTKHAPETVSTIALVPDGGNYKSLPENLRGTRRVNIAWTRYSSVRPSLTIDTGHRHHFHYKYNRIPTVRESARLQSFPD
jgi:DNA (cytosine-5)-methyltransferase 1